jgi:hypothetical protein
MDLIDDQVKAEKRKQKKKAMVRKQAGRSGTGAGRAGRDSSGQTKAQSIS